MSGPRNAIGTHDSFTNGTDFLHRRLGPLVASVDPEFDPPDAAIESALQHHVLDAPVEAGATLMRAIIGAADLQYLTRFIDTEVAGHACKLIAFEQDERAVVGVGYVTIDAVVEAFGTKIVGVNLPDIAVLGAGGFQLLAMFFAEQLGSATNFSFAAYFIRTRWATSRWRKAVFWRSAFRTASSSWPSSDFTNTVA